MLAAGYHVVGDEAQNREQGSCDGDVHRYASPTPQVPVIEVSACQVVRILGACGGRSEPADSPGSMRFGERPRARPRCEPMTTALEARALDPHLPRSPSPRLLPWPQYLIGCYRHGRDLPERVPRLAWGGPRRGWRDRSDHRFIGRHRDRRAVVGDLERSSVEQPCILVTSSLNAALSGLTAQTVWAVWRSSHPTFMPAFHHWIVGAATVSVVARSAFAGWGSYWSMSDAKGAAQTHTRGSLRCSSSWLLFAVNLISERLRVVAPSTRSEQPDELSASNWTASPVGRSRSGRLTVPDVWLQVHGPT